MGCCTSTARISNPERATEAVITGRDLFALRGIVEEDEKTQDKASLPPLSLNLHESVSSTKFATKTPPETEKNEDKDIEISSRRTGSSPDLQPLGEKDDIIHGRQNYPDVIEEDCNKEPPKSALRLDESHVRISKEQHREIMQFVEEKQCSLQIVITQVFQNLANNVKEHEKLSLLMEELKNNGKDVENCFEDLMSYPFPNDREYFMNLRKQNQAYKSVLSEYQRYSKGSQTYKELREKTIINLINYDQALPDAMIYPTRSFIFRENESAGLYGRQQSEVSAGFPARRLGLGDESKNDVSFIDLDFELKIQHQASNEIGSSLANRVLENLPKQSKIQPSGGDDIIYKPENRLAVYYSILDDAEALNETLKEINNGYRVVQVRIQDYRARGDRDSGDASIQWHQIKDEERRLAYGSEELRKEYRKLQRRLNKLRSKAAMDPSEAEGFVQSDYPEKLNELEIMLQNKLKEVDKLTSVFSLIFKEFYHQVSDQYNMRAMANNSNYITHTINSAQRIERVPGQAVYNTQAPQSPGNAHTGLQGRVVNILPTNGRDVQRQVLRKEDDAVRKTSYNSDTNITGPKMQKNGALEARPSTLKGDVQDLTTTEFALEDLSLAGSYKIERKFGTRVNTTVNGDGSSATRDHTRRNGNVLSQTEISH